jgi:ubiquinone/menaquinone biosynthesis C-methylase UbiE
MDKKQQKKYYRKQAANYDNNHLFNRENRNHFKKAQIINELLTPSNNAKILEIGTGTGIHGQYMIKKSINYYGLDISEHMLHQATGRCSALKNRLVCGDGEHLPYSNNSFKGVYFATSLHHLPMPAEGIKEAARVLKPGGKLVLMEPNYWFPKNFLQAHLIPEEKNGKLMRPHYFRKWGEKAGLTLQKIDYYLYTPPVPEALIPLYEVIDNIMKKIPLINKLSIMVSALYILND